MASSSFVRGDSSAGPTRVAAILAVLLLPLISACAVLYNGTTQLLPVTSTPPAAEVFVDGESQGFTPLELNLRRGRDHTITVRLGELERTILVRNVVQPTMVALDLAPAAAFGVTVLAFRASLTGDESDLGAAAVVAYMAPVLLTALVATPVALVVDAATGAWYQLDVDAIEVDFGAP